MSAIRDLLKKKKPSPKERLILWAYNDRMKARTGKGVLTTEREDDIAESWTPKTAEEVIEFNKYSDAWRTNETLELDAQACYLRAREAFGQMRVYISDFIRSPHIETLRSVQEALEKEPGQKENAEKIKKALGKLTSVSEETIETWGKGGLLRSGRKELLLYRRELTEKDGIFEETSFPVLAKDWGDRARFIKEYRRLLGIKKVTDRLSRVFLFNISEEVGGFIEKLDQDASFLNASLRVAFYGSESQDSLAIKTEGLEPLADIASKYEADLIRTLGEAF